MGNIDRVKKACIGDPVSFKTVEIVMWCNSIGVPNMTLLYWIEYAGNGENDN
jgi:hypothetical protein